MDIGIHQCPQRCCAGRTVANGATLKKGRIASSWGELGGSQIVHGKFESGQAHAFGDSDESESEDAHSTATDAAAGADDQDDAQGCDDQKAVEHFRPNNVEVKIVAPALVAESLELGTFDPFLGLYKVSLRHFNLVEYPIRDLRIFLTTSTAVHRQPSRQT